MRRSNTSVIVIAILLVFVQRLPAPIEELSETATPTAAIRPIQKQRAPETTKVRVKPSTPTKYMKGVDVNLPTGQSGQTNTLSDYISVSVDKNGHYFFEKDEVADEELLNRLRMAHQSAPDAKLFVRGDKDSVHLNVTHALDIIRSAGYYKISFEIKSEALKPVPAPNGEALKTVPDTQPEAEPEGTETMAVKGIRVNLPAAVGPPPSGPKDFVSVIVLEGNAVFFDNQYVPDDQVLPRLFQLHRANPDIKISISATPMAIYGDVIRVLDKVRIAGITKVAYQIRSAAAPVPGGAARPQGVAKATPPPEDIPIPEPPPPPDIQPEFVEERTPPARLPNAANFTPIKAPGPMSMSQAKALALYAPRPKYPYEARSRHVTGSAVIIMQVDSASGNVTSASVSQSTGSSMLDNAATSAFRQWRFRPGTVSRINIPITFTMTGASY